MVAHAVAGFVAAHQTAARTAPHFAARHGHTVAIYDINVEETAERMRVLYAARRAFHREHVASDEHVCLVACLKVALCEHPVGRTERLAHGLHCRPCYNERLAVALHIARHHHRETHQNETRMLPDELHLHGVACVATCQKLVKCYRHRCLFFFIYCISSLRHNAVGTVCKASSQSGFQPFQ